MFDPETKGLAIGNVPELAAAHSRHARPETNPLSDALQNKSNGITSSVKTVEAFHYTCYLPHNNHLFELDGLKPYPIDHGPVPDDQTWHDMARQVVTSRISAATGGELSHDIRYNLMAVVPCQIHCYTQKLNGLKRDFNLTRLALLSVAKSLSLDSKELDALTERLSTEQLDSQSNFVNDSTAGITLNSTESLKAESASEKSSDVDSAGGSTSSQTNTLNKNSESESSKHTDLAHLKNLTDLKKFMLEQNLLKYWKQNEVVEVDSVPAVTDDGGAIEIQTVSDGVSVISGIEEEIKQCNHSLKEEIEKRKKYEVDDARRTHDYVPFISLFLAMLEERKLLSPLLGENLVVRKRQSVTLPRTAKSKNKRRRR